MLFIIPLLTGCAREYECDVGTIDANGEFHIINIGGSDTNPEKLFYAKVSVDEYWPYGGEKEAKERCEATYNDTLDHTLIEIIESYRDDAEAYFHCRCEKVN